MSDNTQWDKFTKPPPRDLGLQVGAEIFWVSRRQMADVSPVFESMLYGEFQESKKEIVELHDKEPCDILEMLRCLFPTIGKGLKPVDDGNIDLLLQLADEYQIKYLLEKCSSFLESKIDEDLSIGETMELFTKSNQYHLKGAVRVGLRALAKFEPAELLKMPSFNDLSINMRLAVSLMAWFRESRPRPFHEYFGIGDIWPDDFSGIRVLHRSVEKCKFCGYERCGLDDCTEHSHNQDRPPECYPICRTCKERYGSTDFVCKCFDPIIEAELEKLGL